MLLWWISIIKNVFLSNSTGVRWLVFHDSILMQCSYAGHNLCQKNDNCSVPARWAIFPAVLTTEQLGVSQWNTIRMNVSCLGPGTDLSKGIKKAFFYGNIRCQYILRSILYEILDCECTMLAFFATECSTKTAIKENQKPFCGTCGVAATFGCYEQSHVCSTGTTEGTCNFILSFSLSVSKNEKHPVYRLTKNEDEAEGDNKW